MSNALRPLFVTVTWGAGGSTSTRSLELAEICQRQLGLTTCLHLTCTNMSKHFIDEALREAKELGIQNILALRGDPPRGAEYRTDELEYEGAEEFVWAADLVRYIRKQYGGYFCIGVAGYPEGHSDESNPIDQDPKRDMPHLVEKVRAGGDFIMTQLFYDAEAFLSYEKLVREWDNGVLGNIPIVPGLMPIQSYQVLKRVTKLSHASLPPDILDKVERVKGDDESVKRVGVNILSSIVEQVKQQPSFNRRGFHFYTLNLEKVVSFILERCNLIPVLNPEFDFTSAIDDSDPSPLTNGVSHSPPNDARRPSSPHNRMTSDSRSTSTLEPLSRATTLAITHGVGSLGREATWDDYPNGRFGDARSPAFGEIDGYGPSLHLSPAGARRKWGEPSSRASISALFVAHLRGDLDALPWSEGAGAPLSLETRIIEPQLVALIERRGWWSVASQPAANGVSSADPVFGWGPRGGFVFQKAFVEFWIPAREWRDVLRPYLLRSDVAPKVSWYAAANPQRATAPPAPAASLDEDAPPEFESSSPASAVDSVTWGSFPGKEIVTPTLIEEISFRAWADEAFGIWREWEQCYPPASVSREVIGGCAEDMWLVNVIGQAYQRPGELWEVLMAA